MDVVSSLVAIGKIGVVDAAASIDNVVTIRNVVGKYNLTEQQRKTARNWGIGLAALFRITALAVACSAPLLITNPATLSLLTAGVMLVGAGFLAALAWEMAGESLKFLGAAKWGPLGTLFKKLHLIHTPEEKLESAKEEVTSGKKPGFLTNYFKRHPLAAAILHVGAQDFMQSLDNVAVVLIFAGGSLLLGSIGTLLSIGMMWYFLKALDGKKKTPESEAKAAQDKANGKPKYGEAVLHGVAAVLLGQAVVSMVENGVTGLATGLTPMLAHLPQILATSIMIPGLGPMAVGAALTIFTLAAVAVYAGVKAHQSLGVLQEKVNGTNRPISKEPAPALAVAHA